MNDQQVLVGFYMTLEKSGARNIVERARKAARAAGAKFSNEQASLWLKAFVSTHKKNCLTVNGRKTDGVADVQTDGNLSTKRTENGRGRGRETDSRVVKVSLDTKPSTSPPYPSDTPEPLDGETPPERPEKTPKRPKTGREVKPLELKARVLPAVDDPGQPAWVVCLRRELPDLQPVALRDLDVDQRFRIAMYHAWRWANCTRDERTNRKHAASICAGIANLSQHKVYGSMTVAEYIFDGDELWKNRGMSPWFKPWDITGQVEPAPPAERQAYAGYYQGR